MGAKILITGATGNTGVSVVRFLSQQSGANEIILGVRNVEKAKETFAEFKNVSFRAFDFEDQETFAGALKGIDRVFLLRPPHISDVDKYFGPLIAEIKRQQISEILFLSVQGAEKSKVIPHNKIEKLIREAGLSYIFLRPSYFMQNLTTTLMHDITTKREIILPAGDAKFNWIDIENIGEAAAILLNHFEEHKNRAYEITGLENESFKSVAAVINKAIANPIIYRNVNPISFYNIKKREGMAGGLILVMIMLHFLPRFQKEPAISNFYEQLTGKKPANLGTFIAREKFKFEHIKNS